jgi:hypothetical protein
MLRRAVSRTQRITVAGSKANCLTYNKVIFWGTVRVSTASAAFAALPAAGTCRPLCTCARGRPVLPSDSAFRNSTPDVADRDSVSPTQI